MQYYNPSSQQTTALPAFATPETCRDYGYWPIYDAPFPYDLKYYSRNLGPVEYEEGNESYTQTWEPFLLPLDNVRYWKKQAFDEAFTHLETKENRPAASLSLRMAGGESAFPDDDFDVGLLWSIEEIKQSNRDLLTKLNAMTVPDTATFEETQAILASAVAIIPWIPAGY